MDVYPSLTYRDVDAALAQLESAFGLEPLIQERGDDGKVRTAAVRHGGGAVGVQPELPEDLHGEHAGQGWVYVVVEDPESHHARATAAGAEVLGPVHSAFEGRQRGYSARDLEGNLWTFGTLRLEEGELVADNAELARRIIDVSRYLTLATVDASGRPSASPVFFAPGRAGEFLWLSRPDADHSRNIAERPEVSLAIFDSRQAPGTGQGVYVTGRAELVEDGEGIEAYSETSQRCGAPPWSGADVTGDAEFRLYRATADDVWVLDSGNDSRGDRRSRVAL
jgi:uncharacterized glyoxalase superfamily protein PhnB/general stress protein 26